MIVYLARHLLPVANPPVTDGAVAVRDGRIVAAGKKKDVLKAADSASEIRDLGDVALLPGLVNAHTHLEWSWMREDPPSGNGYVEWLGALHDRSSRANQTAAREAAVRAISEMTARGTVAVGDVTASSWTAGVLARSSLYGVVFLEISGIRASEAERLLDEAAARLDAVEAEPEVRAAKGRLGVVLTPQAAYTTSGPLLKALAGRAAASAEVLSIHVAETDAEEALLQDGSGPLAGFLKGRGTWDDAWRPPGHSPVEFLDRLGALSPRTLAVHCVHVGHQDLSKLQARRVTVVTCPRSNLRLGVGKTPVPKLLGSGIPVALGTDSLASAPDLDLFAEMATLRAEHPELSPAAVLRMATLNGARALQLGTEVGSIEAGKAAGLVVVPLGSPEDDPLEAVTSGPASAMSAETAPWETPSA